MRLLSNARAHPKLSKKADELSIEPGILHLTPFTRSGTNLCPFASPECAAACLNTAGHGIHDSVQQARLRRTRWFLEDRDRFMRRLYHEIATLRCRAARRGRLPAVRLNGTSDIAWERIPLAVDGVIYPNLMAAFPDVVFYDYTKIPLHRRQPPANYHLVFSLSESNDRHAIAALESGANVAVVLDYKGTVPETWSGYPVIDGDKHDFRFLDPKGGYIVALKPKGKARALHRGGFVRTPDSRLDPNRSLTLAARIAA